MRVSIWSDDSDEETAAPPAESDSDEVDLTLAMTREAELRAEFNKMFKNYRRASAANIDWPKKCPELEFPVGFTPDMLLKADMGKIMKAELIDMDKDRKKFGYLPAMATTSKGSIGSLIYGCKLL
jgi:hypothetical protein